MKIRFSCLLILASSLAAVANQLVDNNDSAISIIYTGNMGVLINTNKCQVLIDGLHLKYEDDYLNPPKNLLDSMVNSLGHYKIDVLLVTHVHKDHFNAVPVIDFLMKNSGSRLIAPQQVIDTLATHQLFPKVARQVLSAERTPDFAIKGVAVSAHKLLHTWQQRHSSISNYSYIISTGTKKIVHIGDAESNETVFKSEVFAKNQFDAAIVPDWFLRKNASVNTKKYIHATQVIATHINPQQNSMDWIDTNAMANNINVTAFYKLYQKINF